MVATNAACKLFVLLACVVLFQITEPRNVEPRQKIFMGILDHENIFTRKFKTRKFYNTKISRSTVFLLQVLVNGSNVTGSVVNSMSLSVPPLSSTMLTIPLSTPLAPGSCSAAVCRIRCRGECGWWKAGQDPLSHRVLAHEPRVSFSYCE